VLKKYFTKTLLYNLLIALAMLIVLLLLVQWSLKSYTRHGELIPVPDLKGKTLEQTIKLLDEKGLEYKVIDSAFNVKFPALTIVEQTPKSGTNVKNGRTIYLTINASNSPTVEVPDLIGRSSLKYAKMQLESYGLTVGEIIYKPDPHLNALIGLEINGRPVSKKMKVPVGTVVNLILGDGLGNSMLTVPYLIGLRFEEAEFKLRGYSLGVGALVVKEGVSDTAGAIVYKQIPAFGPNSKIRLGEPIDLFVAKELPNGITVDPSLYDIIDTIPSKSE
jgi:beta-lactam-binding protein with PASTA domain